MKINKIITSVNENHNYYKFVPIVVEAWHKLGVSVRINVISENPVWSRQFHKAGADEVILRKPITGVRTSAQAQMSRMLDAACEDNKDDYIMIGDIDMIPLNDGQLKSYERVPENDLALFGAEHPAFQQHPDIGKWPMHGMAAKGETFRKLVNPERLDYYEVIEYWNRHSWKDPRCAPSTRATFCDESLARELLELNPVEVTKIFRQEAGSFKQHPDGGYTVYGRICRSKWQSIDPAELDHYFEIHGPRPYTKEFYAPVESYIKGE